MKPQATCIEGYRIIMCNQYRSFTIIAIAADELLYIQAPFLHLFVRLRRGIEANDRRSLLLFGQAFASLTLDSLELGFQGLHPVVGVFPDNRYFSFAFLLLKPRYSLCTGFFL